MSEIYKVLLSRFEGKISDLDALADRINRAWGFAQTSPSEQDMFLDSVALSLHGFYSGVESLFLQVAKILDEDIPTGEGWHTQLLMQMQDADRLRPALISEGDMAFLDELRRFRHLVRNVYAFNLLPDRVKPLVDLVTSDWPRLRAELKAFEAYLVGLIDAEQESQVNGPQSKVYGL